MLVTFTTNLPSYSPHPYPDILHKESPLYSIRKQTYYPQIRGIKKELNNLLPHSPCMINHLRPVQLPPFRDQVLVFSTTIPFNMPPPFVDTPFGGPASRDAG